MNKYILYCGQEANFQTRSMLIPVEKVAKDDKLRSDLEILRKHAKKTKLTDKNQTFEIDNLLVINYVFKDGIGWPDKTEYSNIVSNLTYYADGNDDEAWYGLENEPQVIINLADGFNHVKNYCRLRQMTSYQNKPIEIVEGFLALTSENGKLYMPPVDTVEEMFAKYYPEVISQKT